MRGSFSSTSDPRRDPLRHLEVFGFLARHYKKLAATLDQHLTSDSQAYDSKITKLRVRTAREDLNSWALKEMYPDAVRCALFTAMYSQFEHCLNKTCKELEPMHDKKLSDINGQGIKRGYDYLKKVAGIMSPFSNSSWQKLMDLNKLRNAIVHANGVIESAQETRNIVEQINTWAPLTTKDSRVILSTKFIRTVSDVFHCSAKELFTVLRSSIWTST
jgi:hypothetical protein